MTKLNKVVAQQIHIRTAGKQSFIDPETREELNDPKHIMAIKKSRQEYRRGEVRPFKELFNKLK